MEKVSNIVNNIFNKDTIPFLLINLLFVDNYIILLHYMHLIAIIIDHTIGFEEDTYTTLQLIILGIIFLLSVVMLVVLKSFTLIFYCRRNFERLKNPLLKRFLENLRYNNSFRIVFMVIIFSPYLIQSFCQRGLYGHLTDLDLLEGFLWDLVFWLFVSAVPGYIALFIYWHYAKNINDKQL